MDLGPEFDFLSHQNGVMDVTTTEDVDNEGVDKLLDSILQRPQTQTDFESFEAFSNSNSSSSISPKSGNGKKSNRNPFEFNPSVNNNNSTDFEMKLNTNQQGKTKAKHNESKVNGNSGK
jgi:hypothetical protein